MRNPRSRRLSPRLRLRQAAKVPHIGVPLMSFLNPLQSSIQDGWVLPRLPASSSTRPASHDYTAPPKIAYRVEVRADTNQASSAAFFKLSLTLDASACPIRIPAACEICASTPDNYVTSKVVLCEEASLKCSKLSGGLEK